MLDFERTHLAILPDSVQDWWPMRLGGLCMFFQEKTFDSLYSLDATYHFVQPILHLQRMCVVLIQVNSKIFYKKTVVYEMVIYS